MKPDPSEESTLAQIRRPLSTSNLPDAMTPGTPHSAGPSQSFGDEKRHMSMDDVQQHHQQQSQHLYRQQSFPPQTPLTHSQPYEFSSASYSQQHDGPQYQIQISTASAKRKAQRASQACETCRQLKAKCDELKPCKSCKDKKVECKYREAAPKQQDKIQGDILEHLMAMRSDFQAFISANDRRVSRLEEVVHRIGPALEARQAELRQEMRIKMEPNLPLDTEPDPMIEDDDELPQSSNSHTPGLVPDNASSPGDTIAPPPGPPIDIEQARHTVQDMEHEKEEAPGPFVRPGIPTIPPNHTTLAAFLLKWRPIDALARKYLDAEGVKYVDEFPIRQEEKRGLLRVWGRGEGLDSSRSDTHDLGMMEQYDEYSDAGQSPADVWGGISGSPQPMSQKPGSHTLDFNEENVWKYMQSYLDNIQNMHPLIIPTELQAMVKVFLDGLHYKPRPTPGHAAFAGGAAFMGHSETGVKRKRSPAPDAPESSSSAWAKQPGKPMFQRSINNALVLLVLALGKICLHTKSIPDVVPVGRPIHYESQFVQNGHAGPVPQSPSQSSPSSYVPQSPVAPSPRDGMDRPGPSRRSSFQGQGQTVKPIPTLKRNLDVIPGLDYFAYATDILGGQLAGTSLRHIHAYILAGLYHGQLGRVLESYAYIKEAGWALQMKMRPSLDRFKKLQQNQTNNNNAVTDKSDNQLVFAYWTCLQLESDIIAELPLPQSHILAFEDIIPYPNINLAMKYDFNQNVLRSYLAQLYLRKSLNQIHHMLYDPDKPQPLEQSPMGGQTIIEHIQSSLDMRFVPPEYKFRLNDPPAKDILSARLRAKYWGAQVITFRPFIKQILDYNWDKKIARGGEDEPVSPMDSPRENESELDRDARVKRIQRRIESDMGIPEDMSLKLIEQAIKGIRALTESTRAFHGVDKKRLIITNVFGTAHAQWGNLLTLAAIYKDATLREFVDETLLKELFARTIAFFRTIAVPSSALCIDLRILEGVHQDLWGPIPNVRPNGTEAVDHPTGSTMSSGDSNRPSMPPMSPPIPPPPPHLLRRSSPGEIGMLPLIRRPLPGPDSGPVPPPIPPIPGQNHGFMEGVPTPEALHGDLPYVMED